MIAYPNRHVMSMQHVITQKDLTSVHVILDIVVMDFHVVVRDIIFKILYDIPLEIIVTGIYTLVFHLHSF